jgi:CcmD family protein
LKNFQFLFWAYNAFWLILAGYVTYLLVRLQRAEKEVRRLEERIRR